MTVGFRDGAGVVTSKARAVGKSPVEIRQGRRALSASAAAGPSLLLEKIEVEQSIL